MKVLFVQPRLLQKQFLLSSLHSFIIIKFSFCVSIQMYSYDFSTKPVGTVITSNDKNTTTDDHRNHVHVSFYLFRK